MHAATKEFDKKCNSVGSFVCHVFLFSVRLYTLIFSHSVVFQISHPCTHCIPPPHTHTHFLHRLVADGASMYVCVFAACGCVRVSTSTIFRTSRIHMQWRTTNIHVKVRSSMQSWHTWIFRRITRAINTENEWEKKRIGKEWKKMEGRKEEWLTRRSIYGRKLCEENIEIRRPRRRWRHNNGDGDAANLLVRRSNGVGLFSKCLVDATAHEGIK